jgi:cytochrome c-type biogenesis protein
MVAGPPVLIWAALSALPSVPGPLVAVAGGGAGALVEHSPLGFVVAFGAGVISFLSPCVLPLVPSYLSMMSGVGVSTAGGEETARRARILWSSVLFVAGFSIVFALLEATASAVSEPLRAHKPVLDDVAGALIIVMGLVIAGLVRAPWLQRERRFAVRPSVLGPWAAPVMGMTFAFGWTPCITPVLAAVLGLASSGGTLARGEAMLVAYSLGLGVPFVVTGLAFGRLSGALSFARRHSHAVSLSSGLLLAALGVLIITGQVGVLSSWSQSVLQHIGLGSLTTS